MHKSSQKLTLIKNKVNEIIHEKQLKTNPKIIVVTKTFALEKITPLIEGGHIHFGENKIQEAENKWHEVKKKFINLKLHMIGKLQSNKAKKAIKIFDYIHSLDNAKLASKIFQYEKELNKKIKLFIQVNLADETQKSGILLNDLNNFYHYCTKELSLNVIDLTGAGDLFAAGFLHGHINDLSIKESLEKGTEMSSKIIQKIGARLN